MGIEHWKREDIARLKLKIQDDHQNKIKTLEKENARLIAMYKTLTDPYDKEIAELKANHADMVARNAALRDRPDIPTERVKSVRNLVDKNKELKADVELLAEALKRACTYTADYDQYEAIADKYLKGK